MSLSPLSSATSSRLPSRPTSPQSLPPESMDAERMPLRGTPRRAVVATGWRASREVEFGAGLTTGLVVAALPIALASSSRSIQLLAPVSSQIFTTVGATIGGFSHVSELRRIGGDPHGYGIWRGVGTGTAVMTPMLGAITSHALNLEAFDPSLFFGCLLSGALIVSSGMWLQKTLDHRPATPEARYQNRGESYAAGVTFVAAIVWQAATLTTDTYHRAKEAGGLLPVEIEGRGAAAAVMAVSGLMAVGGFAAGAHAREHHNESLRVAGLTIGLVGIGGFVMGSSLAARPA